MSSMNRYGVGDAVQYYSTSHACWVDGMVEQAAGTGEIQVSCKAGYWMPKVEQDQRLRPAMAASSPGLGTMSPATGALSPANRSPANLGRQPGLPPGSQASGYSGSQALGALWSAEQAIGLGAHGEEEISWAMLLDRREVSSVHAAVKQLNEADPPVPEEFCVAYSASSQSYYLLYRRGYREKALAQLMERFREVTASIPALQDQLRKTRAELEEQSERSSRFEAGAQLADAAASRMAQAEREVARLKEALKASEADRASGSGESAARLKQAQQEVASLREATATAEREREAAQREAAKLRAAVAEAEAARGRSRVEIEDLKAQLKASAEKAQDKGADKGLEEFLAAAEKELSLQTALASEEERRKRLEKVVLESEAQKRDLEMRLAAAEKMIGGSSQAAPESGGQDERCKRLQKALIEQEAVKKDLETRLAAAEKMLGAGGPGGGSSPSGGAFPGVSSRSPAASPAASPSSPAKAPAAALGPGSPNSSLQLEQTVRLPKSLASLNAQEWSISLKKNPNGTSRVGVDFDFSDGVTLLIDRVNEGLVMEWNVAHPDQAVRPGDRIVAVNGSRGAAPQLVEVCKMDETLRMLIQRRKGTS